jgi:excisionase family DNA binding protein
MGDPEAGMVDIERAAELLGVSEWTVRRMVRDGRLPAYQYGRGGAIRISVSELHAAMAGWHTRVVER